MNDSPSPQESQTPPELLPDQPRRGFIASAGAIVIGGLVSLTPLITGTLFFLDPLLRKKEAKGDKGEGGDDDGFIKVDATLEQLKEADAPVQVSVIASRVDKWNRYPEQAIGSVYLQLDEEDGESVRAFNVTCPHLGCAVEYRENPEEKKTEYYCPCHQSAFTVTGERKNTTPPRNLDSLDVKVVKNDQNVEELWVKYQAFRTGLKEKVPV